MPESTWLWHMLAFIGVWTVELSSVQAVTLVPPWGSSKKFARLALCIRSLIDLCFVTALTFAMSLYVLAGICLLAFAVHFGLLTHYRHLNRPLSILSLISNWREGIKSWPRSAPWLLAGSTWLLSAALVVKLALLLTTPTTALDPTTRWTVVLLAVGGFAGLTAMASYVDPLKGICGSRGLGRIGMMRGYFFTWLGEIYYCGGHDILEHAIRQSRIIQDRLTPIEANIPIRDHLVFIQTESLDFNALGFEVEGSEVTPFLNRLRETALFYRLAGARYMGSADVDFTMLAGAMPSTRVINFKIPGFPYVNALPNFLARHGFHTAMFHGNTGSFYNRQPTLARMGFSEIFFKEDLMRRADLAVNPWGIDDRDVLRISAEQLRLGGTRVCHFIVTMTTHTPYTYVSPEDWQVFPKPRSMAQHFLNNMRYIDNRLREYAELVRGATIVIYGDHAADPALAESREFKSHWQDGREFIPCFIFDSTCNLGELQQTRVSGTATDGSLTLLDVSGYLRAQVARNYDVRPDTIIPAAGAPVAG
jgi:Sulfatase